MIGRESYKSRADDLIYSQQITNCLFIFFMEILSYVETATTSCPLIKNKCCSSLAQGSYWSPLVICHFLLLLSSGKLERTLTGESRDDGCYKNKYIPIWTNWYLVSSLLTTSLFLELECDDLFGAETSPPTEWSLIKLLIREKVQCCQAQLQISHTATARHNVKLHN